MRPRVGQMLASTVDTTTVIVVRCPEHEVDITCGGAAMTEENPPGPATGTVDPQLSGGSLLGSATRTRNSVWSCCAPSRGRAPWR